MEQLASIAELVAHSERTTLPSSSSSSSSPSSSSTTINSKDEKMQLLSNISSKKRSNKDGYLFNEHLDTRAVLQGHELFIFPKDDQMNFICVFQGCIKPILRGMDQESYFIHLHEHANKKDRLLCNMLRRAKLTSQHQQQHLLQQLQSLPQSLSPPLASRSPSNAPSNSSSPVSPRSPMFLSTSPPQSPSDLSSSSSSLSSPSPLSSSPLPSSRAQSPMQEQSGYDTLSMLAYQQTSLASDKDKSQEDGNQKKRKKGTKHKDDDESWTTSKKKRHSFSSANKKDSSPNRKRSHIAKHEKNGDKIKKELLPLCASPPQQQQQQQQQQQLQHQQLHQQLLQHMPPIQHYVSVPTYHHHSTIEQGESDLAIMRSQISKIIDESTARRTFSIPSLSSSPSPPIMLESHLLHTQPHQMVLSPSPRSPPRSPSSSHSLNSIFPSSSILEHFTQTLPQPKQETKTVKRYQPLPSPPPSAEIQWIFPKGKPVLSK